MTGGVTEDAEILRECAKAERGEIQSGVYLFEPTPRQQDAVDRLVASGMLRRETQDGICSGDVVLTVVLGGYVTTAAGRELLQPQSGGFLEASRRWRGAEV